MKLGAPLFEATRMLNSDGHISLTLSDIKTFIAKCRDMMIQSTYSCTGAILTQALLAVSPRIWPPD